MADLFPRASADFIRRNPALFGGGVRRPSGREARPVPPLAPKAPAEWPAMNRTEARCLERLRERFPAPAVILAQKTRFLPLRGGGSYTPDFLVLSPGHPALVVEVKGGYKGPGWEQGMERYRRAAAQWSDGRVLQFELHTWDRRRREWRVEAWE